MISVALIPKMMSFHLKKELTIYKSDIYDKKVHRTEKFDALTIKNYFMKAISLFWYLRQVLKGFRRR